MQQQRRGDAGWARTYVPTPRMAILPTMGTSRDGTNRGGKQPGAGRNPGGRFTAASAAIGTAAAAAKARARQDSPPPAVQLACALRASSVPLPDIATRLSVTETRLRHWFRDFPALVQAAEVALRGSAQEALAHLQPTVVKVFSDGLVSESESRRLRAAEDVADYLWPRTGAVPGGLHVTINYGSYEAPGEPREPTTVHVIEHERADGGHD